MILREGASRMGVYPRTDVTEDLVILPTRLLLDADQMSPPPIGFGAAQRGLVTSHVGPAGMGAAPP